MLHLFQQDQGSAPETTMHKLTQLNCRQARQSCQHVITVMIKAMQCRKRSLTHKSKGVDVCGLGHAARQQQLLGHVDNCAWGMAEHNQA